MEAGVVGDPDDFLNEISSAEVLAAEPAHGVVVVDQDQQVEGRSCLDLDLLNRVEDRLGEGHEVGSKPQVGGAPLIDSQARTASKAARTG